MVGEGAFDWGARLRLVEDGVRDRAGLHGADVFPADAVFARVAFAAQAHADQPLAHGEHNPPARVVPRVVLVLAHHGELDAVYVQKLLKRKAELLGYKNIKFDERLSSNVRSPKRRFARPQIGKPIKKCIVEPRIFLCPALGFERRVPALAPQFRVVRRHAVKRKRTDVC